MANPIEAAEVLEHGATVTRPPRRPIASPLGWSSIFAGAVVAISVWLLLHLFGIGIGLTAIQPEDASSLRSIGIGTGIWSLIAPLIALFVGGLVAGRVAPTASTLTAAIHGGVVWGVTSVLAFVATLMMIGAFVRGASTATSAVVSAAPASQIGRLPGVLGLDARDLVAPINQRLQAQGMPTITPEQIQNVVQDAVDRAVRQGGVDREALVAIIARDTALSRVQAEQVATQVESEVIAAARRGHGVATQVAQSALEAAEAAGKLVLWGAVMMLLGLGAAVGGSIVSVRRGHDDVRLPRATTTSTT